MPVVMDANLGLAGTIRERLQAGETLNLRDLDAELGSTFSPAQIRNGIRNARKRVPIEALGRGDFKMATTRSATATKPAAKSATVPTPTPAAAESDSTSADIRRRLHAGEWLNADLVAQEYGVSRSLFGVILSDLRKQGFKTRSSGRKLPGEDRYRNFATLAKKPGPSPAETASPSASGSASTRTGGRARKATKGGAKRTPARVARAVKVTPEASNGHGDWSGPEMEGGPDDDGSGDMLAVPRRRGKVKATDAPALGARLKVVALALERGDVVVRLEGDGELWTAVLRRGPGD